MQEPFSINTLFAQHSTDNLKKCEDDQQQAWHVSVTASPFASFEQGELSICTLPYACAYGSAEWTRHR